ncbi:hypothetical protein A3736_13915 [Erythrobacter sp. HI0063]|uniref:hypothetical protein n=1 Tax=Erythrobacter sp. HI0063 TaxID=1822240 RepID=UPI0007C2B877|nr:hypothetical protein [Erythrobacter sp. HI0063]KZY54609.1 hypothetical protein A3736_13915 [Erythrobacter sp. HI0063]
MLYISTANTLAHILETGCDRNLNTILARYQEHLSDEPIAELFVIQPGDLQSDLARCRGRPFKLWEFIDFADGWYEAVFIISDDGFGHVVLIPDQPSTDPTLRAICKAHGS